MPDYKYRCDQCYLPCQLIISLDEEPLDNLRCVLEDASPKAKWRRVE